MQITFVHLSTKFLTEEVFNEKNISQCLEINLISSQHLLCMTLIICKINYILKDFYFKCRNNAKKKKLYFMQGFICDLVVKFKSFTHNNSNKSS